jgi:hypothetical protein
MTKQPDQIVAAAAGKIDEQLLAAAFAKPRGATTAVASGGTIAREIGSQWAGKHRKGAEAAGIEVGNPGAIAVTPSSLVTMSVGVSLTGKIKEVKEVLSVVPLAEVDSLEVKRFGMAGVMELAVAGQSFKLEGKVDDMRGVAEAFNRAKATNSA